MPALCLGGYDNGEQDELVTVGLFEERLFDGQDAARVQASDEVFDVQEDGVFVIQAFEVVWNLHDSDLAFLQLTLLV